MSLSGAATSTWFYLDVEYHTCPCIDDLSILGCISLPQGSFAHKNGMEQNRKGLVPGSSVLQSTHSEGFQSCPPHVPP